MGEDFFKEGEELPEEEPGWHPPVPCPQCKLMETRFVTLQHEMSVYECERCGEQFEVEEDA
jgi:DNA-directed RNA polymerase subunit RPC12/RpoP